MLKKTVLRLGLLAALLLPVSAAEAATLYITEFASPVSNSGSQQAQNLGQPAISTQTVAIGAGSVQSAAFSAGTHGVQAYCDSGCSVAVGTNPTATTSTQVLTANQPQTFTVVPGQIMAVIANPSGNTSGGGGGGGTSSTFGAAFPATGTAVGAKDNSGNMAALNLDASGNLKVSSPTGSSSNQVQGTAAAGAVPVGNPVYIGGSDGTDIRAWAMNSLGFGSTQDAADVQEGGAIANTIIGVAGSDGTNAHHIKTDTSGNQIAVGNVASGAADSGNPVEAGCNVNTSTPAFSNGNRAACQVDTQGTLYTRPVLQQSAATDGYTNTFLGSPNISNVPHASGGFVITTGGLSWMFNGTSYDRQFTCPLSAIINTPLGTTTQLVALSGSTVIRVCSFVITESLSGSATFEYGTGALCASGTTALTGAMALPTGGDISLSSGNGSLFRTAAANALCLAAATGNITGFVTYAQY